MHIKKRWTVVSSGCIKASLASQLVETVAYVFTDILFLDSYSPYFFLFKMT